MTEMPQYHDQRYDPIVEEAVRFSTDNLGLDVTSKDHIAVMQHDSSQADAARHRYDLSGQSGGYDMRSGDLLYIHTPNPDTPRSSRIQLGSSIVHELTHSGTANLNEHPFYREALAGMGEHKYMKWLAEHGVHKVAADMMLQRSGVELKLPGEMRRVHAAEAMHVGEKAVSTQGLIAALGIGYGLRASGGKSADILRASRPGGTRQYDMMKRSLDTLQPGLSKQVEVGSGSTDDIIRATARVQQAARRVGIV